VAKPMTMSSINLGSIETTLQAGLEFVHALGTLTEQFSGMQGQKSRGKSKSSKSQGYLPQARGKSGQTTSQRNRSGGRTRHAVVYETQSPEQMAQILDAVSAAGVGIQPRIQRSWTQNT
jgi:hypothetical protein